MDPSVKEKALISNISIWLYIFKRNFSISTWFFTKLFTKQISWDAGLSIHACH